VCVSLQYHTLSLRSLFTIHHSPHSTFTSAKTDLWQPHRLLTLLLPHTNRSRSEASTPVHASSGSPLITMVDGFRAYPRRDRYSAVDSPSDLDSESAIKNDEKETVAQVLEMYQAVSVIAYDHKGSDARANDIWPNFRSSNKQPAPYRMLKRVMDPPEVPLVAPKEQLSEKLSADAAFSDTQTGRPIWKLPLELVEHIAGYMNRDDVKSLRLVSRELDHLASQVIFKTVVVPFNTEIYGMLEPAAAPDLKGKKRAGNEKPEYLWKNASGDDVYDGHGLDVFRGFGKHITRYGMSFEVNEDMLACIPDKNIWEHKKSFWGTYDWPSVEYRRYDEVAGLEDIADETPRMKVAFSELSKVKELALSIDSGLGWMNGPDLSIRARILQKPPTVFGTLKDIPDRPAQAQRELWEYIQACFKAVESNITYASLYRMEDSESLSESLKTGSLVPAEHQPSMLYLAPRIIRESIPHNHTAIATPSTTSVGEPAVVQRVPQPPISSRSGILFASNLVREDRGCMIRSVVPTNLTHAQKEWLMETEWAQRAFLSSYMLSVIDNPVTFGLVHTLTISRLPDQYLPMLDRPDFWDALPTLRNVTLMVIPSWRTVNKDPSGMVTMPSVSPMAGIDSFCGVLLRHIVFRPNIKHLTIGWASGGEHAEGMLARNRMVMPAPLMPGLIPSDTDTPSIKVVEQDKDRLRTSLLRFPHVERLTLRNCWITPHSIMAFVKIHDIYSLKHLVLDSVSITPVLRLGNNPATQPAPHPPVFNPGSDQTGGYPIIPGLNLQNGIVRGNSGVANPGPMTSAQFLSMYIRSLRGQLRHLCTDTTSEKHQDLIKIAQTHLEHLLQTTINAQIRDQAGSYNLPMSVITQATALAIQVQRIQHQVVAATHAAPPATGHAISLRSAIHLLDLQSSFREGSWLHVIDQISPGLNLSDYGNPFSKAHPNRRTSLDCIEFISCGYVTLPNTSYIHVGIDNTDNSDSFPLWQHRDSIKGAMLPSNVPHLGKIMQVVDRSEYHKLYVAWDLKQGWDDANEAWAAEFDGQLRGGTGRFSNKIQRSDRLATCSSSE
jgi:hypothetical protein